MIHEIRNLQSAKLVQQSPWLPSSPRGAKAKGLSFERRVGKFLRRHFPQTLSGQWIEYLDAGEKRHAQVDHLVLSSLRGLIIECKLTHSRSARRQLEKLYLPLLRSIYPGVLFSLVEWVHHYGWRFSHEEEPFVIHSLDEAWERCAEPPPFLIHSWS